MQLVTNELEELTILCEDASAMSPSRATATLRNRAIWAWCLRNAGLFVCIRMNVALEGRQM